MGALGGEEMLQTKQDLKDAAPRWVDWQEETNSKKQVAKGQEKILGGDDWQVEEEKDAISVISDGTLSVESGQNHESGNCPTPKELVVDVKPVEEATVAGDLVRTYNERIQREERHLEIIGKAVWRMCRSNLARKPTSVRATELHDNYVASWGKLNDVKVRICPFDCAEPPAISLTDYLKRLVQTMNMNVIDVRDELDQEFSFGFRMVLCALVLIDRLLNRQPDLALSRLNVHRIFLVTMLCISKFSEDEPLNNRFWAGAGGILLSELNVCELKLVRCLDFNFRVTEQAIRQVAATLQLY